MRGAATTKRRGGVVGDECMKRGKGNELASMCSTFGTSLTIWHIWRQWQLSIRGTYNARLSGATHPWPHLHKWRARSLHTPTSFPPFLLSPCSHPSAVPCSHLCPFGCLLPALDAHKKFYRPLNIYISLSLPLLPRVAPGDATLRRLLQLLLQ